MILMTASVRPEQNPTTLRAVQQYLRRHYSSSFIKDDAFVVKMPDVGRVLVTLGLSVLRLDLVAGDNAAADSACLKLEQYLRAQVAQQSLLISWAEGDIIPPALR